MAVETYDRQYWVVDSKLPLEIRIKIYSLAAENNISVGPSYNDAGIGALLHLPNKIVIWERYPKDQHQELVVWFNKNYPGSDVVFRYLEKSKPDPTPDPVPIVIPGSSYIGPIGLHASTDPDILENEINEFRILNAGIIKVLSGQNNKEGIRALAALPGKKKWIVRPYYSFGGRNIPPHKFYMETIVPLQETIGIIRAHGHTDFVIEVHNEPNLVLEGYSSTWKSGLQFAIWFNEVCSYYQSVLPGERFIYPGLSPGHLIPDVRPESDESFYKAAKPYIIKGGSIAGYGVHAYWAEGGIKEAVQVVAKAQGIIGPKIPFWVTEASDKSLDSSDVKARRMVSFYRSLPSICKGITFFAASSNDPEFAREIWVTRNMAQRIREKI